MTPIDAGLKAFFSEYEKLFSTLDFRKQADLFADTFISAGPNGVISQSKEGFLKLAEMASEYYRSVGQKYTRILNIDEVPISNEYSWVKVHWGAAFEKTGEKLIEFDVSYFVWKSPNGPRIIMFIAHQDEQKAMQELGITSIRLHE